MSTAAPRRRFGPLVPAALVLALLAVVLVPVALRATTQPGGGRDARPVRSLILIDVSRSLGRPASTPVTAEEHARFLETTRTLLKSSRVLDQALRSVQAGGRPLSQTAVLANQADPLTWLAEHLRVDLEGEVLAIALDGGPPAEQAAIVNAVTEAFLEVVNGRTMARLNSTQVENQQRLATIQARLRQKRVQLLEVTDEEGAAPDSEAVAQLLRIAIDLDSSLLGMRAEQAGLEARRERLAARGEADAADLARVEDDLAALAARRKVVEEERRSLAGRIDSARRLAPELAALRDEISRLELEGRRLSQEVDRLENETDQPTPVQLIDSARMIQTRR